MGTLIDRRAPRCIGRGIVASLIWLLACVPGSSPYAVQGPQISIIIDDLGNQRESGLRAVDLPGPVAYAFLPHAPHAAELAEIAHRNGKEVILHLPMQSHSDRRLGPGGVTTAMGRVDLVRVVSAGLRSVPHVTGVSNHMGSLLTRQREAMGWLMDLLRVRENLFFVDSRTTRLSTALEVAQQRGVPSTSRDVFLDNELDETAIFGAFHRLLRIARRRGTALAIGHPHDETLAMLAHVIPRLNAHGVRLVPVAALIRSRESLRPPLPGAIRFRSARQAGPGIHSRRPYFFSYGNQSFSLGQAASTR
ncbi:MAG TPA: divergent polysaccharide deacetylase family protein [Gammaproteobacteria bacterium]|nr:divergent polysaccharide deacetylase family protein [Gammaproteobacteria bacterium]